MGSEEVVQMSRKKLNKSTVDMDNPAVANILKKKQGLADPRELLWALGYSERKANDLYAARKKNGMQKKGTVVSGALLMTEGQFNDWHAGFTQAA